jgi:hypothetical protein
MVILSDVRTPPELIWIGNTPGVAIFRNHYVDLIHSNELR